KASGPTSFPTVAAGQSVSTTFTVTSSTRTFNGDLVGRAEWRSLTSDREQVGTTVEKVRNDSPIKINEFRVGTSTNPTDSYIELYNAGSSSVDISGWTLTERPTQQAINATTAIPAGIAVVALMACWVGRSVKVQPEMSTLLDPALYNSIYESVGLVLVPTRNSLILMGLSLRTFSTVVPTCSRSLVRLRHSARPTRSPLNVLVDDVTVKVVLTL